MLTDTQVEEFWREGYLHLPNFFHPADIAPLLNEYYRIFLPQLRINGILPADIEHCPTWPELVAAINCMKSTNHQLYDNCRKQIKRSIIAHQLVMDTRILAIIQQLGIDIPSFHQCPQLTSDPYTTHKCDQLWKLWKPSCNAIAGFMYLGDTQHHVNSLLHLVPGSHTSGVRAMSDIDSIHTESYQAIYGSCHKDSIPPPGMSQYGTDLVLFSPLVVSSLPYSPDNLAALTWCYSDLNDPFYLQYAYRPHVSAPVGDALIEFLATREKYSQKK